MNRTRIINSMARGVDAITSARRWVSDAKTLRELALAEQTLHEVQTFATLALDLPNEASHRFAAFINGIE
jgi:hypothetical protein